MVRPRRCRFVQGEPEVSYFKPKGVPMRELEEVEVCVDEFEALRLKDHEQLDQNSAAEKMGVSQPTFHRLYSEARRKVAKGLVEGLAIKIVGGVYQVRGKGQCGSRGKGKGRGCRQGRNARG
ncbi:DUF134 domain-containing protein [Nanoarchaeota archaeon]